MNYMQNINELPDDNNLQGPISDLIKIVRACEKAGIDVRNVMNVLRRPDRKEVLKEINQFKGKTETQRRLDEMKAQEERARDFGIGE